MFHGQRAMPLQKYTSIVAQGGGWHKKKPRAVRGALAAAGGVHCIVSQGTGRDFANLTLIVYHIPVAAQFVIKGPGG